MAKTTCLQEKTTTETTKTTETILPYHFYQVYVAFSSHYQRHSATFIDKKSKENTSLSD